ncbi:Fe-S cluster assembly protein SufD [Pleomorphomonas koreensis]|uniref:Fe-S cluster assembly protein SufD n=1 Tax=Pleomorphomonas koreensis TaxID=257440 RepID=UPI00047EE5D1|nr:Fe-S cluster assembly protein SufD [Pleomorphomonas koreensis]
MAATPARTPAEQALAARYPAERTSLPGTADVIAIRDAAFGGIEKTGLPHRRVEDWKYTDLRARLKTFPPAAGPADVARVLIARPAMEGDKARRLVVANGRYRPELSDLENLEDGLAVFSLAKALEAGDAAVLAALKLDEATAANTAVALNTAFMTDGLVITVADGAVVERPVEIVHIAEGEPAASTAVRHLVTVGRGAKLTLIETVESLDTVAHHSNIMTVIEAGEEADVDHIRLQLEPDEAVSMTTLVARIGRQATFDTFNAALGAGLARAQVFAEFVGRDAEAGFRGITMLSGRRHADTTLSLIHGAENCRSRELYKAVIDDEARSAFAGRIAVPAFAQKTDARMMTASLLLSEEAEAYAKPELEIFADDVQCGHGATCGAINEDLLFYLLSRGIAKAEAESMLILAFLGEAIDEIQDQAVHDALIHRVEAWLKTRASARKAGEPAA